MTSFSIDELLAALQGAAGESDGAPGVYTARELRELSGMSQTKLLAAIRRLRAEGVLEPTQKMAERIDGVWQLVSAYRYVGVKDDNSA